VTTLHGRLDLPELPPLYGRFRDMPLVSISNAQRAPLPWVNWQSTVYHGLPDNLCKFHSNPEDYLAFIGRISPEKRLDRAIEIAKRSGKRIRIAAKVDPVDERYFRETIQPLMQDPCCEYIGEIGECEKEEFLGNASALLFPIDWPEPFGLVLIEAMARGTPVIAYPHGSVPEIIENGVNGVMVESIEDAVCAVKMIDRLSRARCRSTFEERFTVERMACEYLKVYHSLLAQDSQLGLHPLSIAS